MDISILPGGKYKLNKSHLYYSPRYKASITLPAGMESDGATGLFIPDLMSESWWVHDRICDYPFFDDHRKITAIQAATILSDILKAEGRVIRSYLWKYATFFFGCTKTRQNGWW